MSFGAAKTYLKPTTNAASLLLYPTAPTVLRTVPYAARSLGVQGELKLLVTLYQKP